MVLEHRYDPPQRFVAGTVGEPGQRTFFLQATDTGRITSVAAEKQQVQLLAERVNALLDEIMRARGGDAGIPALAADDRIDAAPLETPIEEDFRAGTMTLAWDDDAKRVIIEVFAFTEDAAHESEADMPGEAEEASEALVVVLTPAEARAFCARAGQVVAAGRPSCQFCGEPMDPDGHLCPRMNGFRRR
jgi:uncharacterized repeat protein (TIGR03847 family)